MRTFVLTFIALLLAANSALAQTLTTLVPGSAFHGVHGIRLAPNGELYAGSVLGQTLYAVNVATGAVRVVEGPPKGMADDIAFGPNGEVVWTAIQTGIVYIRRGDGPAEVLVKDMPGANSLVWTRDGRHLYLGQVFAGDGVWELDPAGLKPPRKIAGPVGGFNSFTVGPDGALYGPLWFKGQIARIDPDTGALRVIAEGLQTPAAAKFSAKGELYAIDTKVGILYHIDIATGAKTQVVQLKTALDNMEFGNGDQLFVSNMADNGIQEVNVKTAAVRQVVKPGLSNPFDLAVSTVGGRDTLFVADGFAYRSIDGSTGKVTDIARAYSDELNNPNAVGMAGDRVLLVGAGRIETRDRVTGRRVAVSEPFRAPTDVVGLPGGDMIVSQANGDIIRVSGETRTVLASGLKMPASIALGPRADLYVAERDGGRIARIDLKSGAVTEAVGNLTTPRAVAVARNGRIVVLDAGARQVVEIDPATNARTILAKDLPLGYLPGAPYGGIAIGGKGDVYLSADRDNAIYKISR